jgi:hypothetical protein
MENDDRPSFLEPMSALGTVLTVATRPQADIETA